MKLLDDTEFDAQFARTVGKAAVGTADVGEVLRHGQPRDRGDYASWRDCWNATAERVSALRMRLRRPVGGAVPVRRTYGRRSTTGRATSSTAWT